MTRQEAVLEARRAELHGHSVVMTVLSDDELMRDLAEALEEERNGYQGKTIDEIRREYGLKD